MGILRDNKGNYKLTGKTTEQDVLAAAEGILLRKLERQGSVANPSDAAEFLRMRLGGLRHEEFHAVWLDNRHRILSAESWPAAPSTARASTSGKSSEPR